MTMLMSIPRQLHARAKRHARKSRRSVSDLYSVALREFLERHAPQNVTDAMNRVCEQVENAADPFVSGNGRVLLERTEW